FRYHVKSLIHSHQFRSTLFLQPFNGTLDVGAHLVGIVNYVSLFDDIAGKKLHPNSSSKSVHVQVFMPHCKHTVNTFNLIRNSSHHGTCPCPCSLNC